MEERKLDYHFREEKSPLTVDSDGDLDIGGDFPALPSCDHCVAFFRCLGITNDEEFGKFLREVNPLWNLLSEDDLALQISMHVQKKECAARNQCPSMCIYEKSKALRPTPDLLNFGKPHRKIGVGASGCVYFPGFFIPSCLPSVPLADMTKLIVKFLSSDAADEEENIARIIDRLDPTGVFHPLLLRRCNLKDFLNEHIVVTKLKGIWESECIPTIKRPATFDKASLLYFPFAGLSYASITKKVESSPTPSYVSKEAWLGFRDLWKGVVVMSSHQFVHFDIQLDNVVFSPEENKARFIDFGLSFHSYPTSTHLTFPHIFSNWPPEWFLYCYYGNKIKALLDGPVKTLLHTHNIHPDLKHEIFKFFKSSKGGMPGKRNLDILIEKAKAYASPTTTVVLKHIYDHISSWYDFTRGDVVRDRYIVYLRDEYFAKAESGFLGISPHFEEDKVASPHNHSPVNLLNHRIQRCITDLDKLLKPHPDHPTHFHLNAANLTKKYDTFQLANTMRFVFQKLDPGYQAETSVGFNNFIKNTMHYSWSARWTPEEALAALNPEKK